MRANIGFIGTGVIAWAIVKGFCSEGDLDHKIYLSLRNEERAASSSSDFLIKNKVIH